MENSSNIKNAVDALLENAFQMYGDAFDSFWMFEDEICPCCGKRRIDSVKAGNEILLSLSSYIFRDYRVLIGYLLCGYCITELVIPGAKQKIKYKKIEENLKNAYLKNLNLSAS